MTAFSDAMVTLFADPNMAEAAYYRRPPYTWQAVNVIAARPNDITGTVRAGALQVDVLASEVTDEPKKGDEVKFGAAMYVGGTLHPAGTVFVVEGSEPDDLMLSWRLTLADHN